MKTFIGLLALIFLGIGLWMLFCNPYTQDLTTFFISFFIGLVFTTMFLILERKKEKKRYKCEKKPELSNIQVLYYGDEKWMLDEDHNIIHL